MNNEKKSTVDRRISNLDHLLGDENSAVETYIQAIKHIDRDQYLTDLIENRDCHSRRVDLLKRQILILGGIPTESCCEWIILNKSATNYDSIISASNVINMLKKGERQKLSKYHNSGKFDTVSRDIIQNDLLPAQKRTHARMHMLDQFPIPPWYS